MQPCCSFQNGRSASGPEADRLLARQLREKPTSRSCERPLTSLAFNIASEAYVARVLPISTSTYGFVYSSVDGSFLNVLIRIPSLNKVGANDEVIFRSFIYQRVET